MPSQVQPIQATMLAPLPILLHLLLIQGTAACQSMLCQSAQAQLLIQETAVCQNNMEEFIQVSKSLKIKGLAGENAADNHTKPSASNDEEPVASTYVLF